MAVVDPAARPSEMRRLGYCGKKPGARSRVLQAVALELLAFFLEYGLPVLHQTVERFLRSALVRHHIVMHALLFGLQKLRIGGFGPEVDDHSHRLQKLTGERRATREARVV